MAGFSCTRSRKCNDKEPTVRITDVDGEALLGEIVEQEAET